VPPTERRGRVHSSTVTVAVLPEPDAGAFKLDMRDVKVETYRAQGPGGQHRNTTDSAIRATHVPTGVVACSAEKSQHRNRELALASLRARLADRLRTDAANSRNGDRRAQVGSGQRSDKIRTVAVQRGRVENHANGRRTSIDRYERGFLEEVQ
jgi:peptide chain release factor 1